MNQAQAKAKLKIIRRVVKEAIITNSNKRKSQRMVSHLKKLSNCI
jgi:hypothetical protein